MSFRRASAILSLLLLVVTGCAQDTTAPLGSADDAAGTFGFPAAAGSIADLRADLERLAIRTVPNKNAFLSKFDALVAALPGDDYGDELLVLLNFLEEQVQQRYLQPPKRGKLTDCVVPNGGSGCETVGALYDEVVAGIMAMVGLSSGPNTTICVLPDGHTSEFCRAPESGGQGTGFVFFPAALFDKLTFVSVKSLGQASVGSGLDEYGFTVEIRTAPVSEFGSVRPTVVACVAPGLDQSLLDRLLLGHRRAEEKYGTNPPFSLLPEAMDPAVEAEAVDYCGAASGGPSVFGLSPESPLNRLLVGARDLFLPAQLSASNAVMLATRGFSGASGSPEEFSTFRAVDRGVTGAGGSPEEFAPQANGADPVPAVTGEIGSEANDVYVLTVATLGAELGVNGVKVTFTLTDPISGLPSSEASFCNGASSVVVYTGGFDDGAPMGSAQIPCLKFGLEAGYKNLSAEIDPTSVDDLACVVDANGLCLLGTDTGNYLVWSKSEPAPDWGAAGYSYLLTSEGAGPTDFHLPSFDDATWSVGNAPFYGGPFPYSNCTLYNATDRSVATVWPIGTTAAGGASDLLVRKQFSMSAAGQVSIQVAIDNDVQVFLNGVDVSGGMKKHEGCATRPALNNDFTFLGSVQAGENVIAIRARDRGVISYLDIRVALVPQD